MISTARSVGSPCERCIQVSQQSISEAQASTAQINRLGQRRDLWTVEELLWLKQNYNKGSMQWLCSELGRTQKAIEQKLYKQRLSISGRKLKEISINPRIQAKTPKDSIREELVCHYPPFHPILLALYPSAIKVKPKLWKARRAIILKMHDYQCFWCGDEATSADHVEPRQNGGTDELNNLVAACHSCNSAHAGRVKTWVDWTPKLSTPVDKVGTKH